MTPLTSSDSDSKEHTHLVPPPSSSNTTRTNPNSSLKPSSIISTTSARSTSLSKLNESIDRLDLEKQPNLPLIIVTDTEPSKETGMRASKSKKETELDGEKEEQEELASQNGGGASRSTRDLCLERGSMVMLPFVLLIFVALYRGKFTPVSEDHPGYTNQTRVIYYTPHGPWIQMSVGFVMMAHAIVSSFSDNERLKRFTQFGMDAIMVWQAVQMIAAGVVLNFYV